MWMSCSSTLKLRVFQIKECSGKVFVIVGHSLTGALRSLLKSNSQRRGKFSTLSLFFRLPAKKCKNLIKGSIHGPQKRKPSENLKCWRACISVSCIPQGCQWWLQGQDIIFVRSRFKGVHPRVDCRRGHPALTYALMVLEGILDKKCHQSSFFSFLFFHLRSTTKNSSLLALSRVHSHQRPKPLPPLALLWRFSLSCLCLTACSQQHAQSYLFPAPSLCLFPACLFSLHLLLMRLAASLHSAHIPSPFAQFSHPSLLMSVEFCPRFTSMLRSLRCIFCYCCCFFSSRLFLCPWVQITSLIRVLFSTRNPESSRAKPWETDVSSTWRRDKHRKRLTNTKYTSKYTRCTSKHKVMFLYLQMLCSKQM